MRVLAWWSAGIASAVACKIALDKYPNAELVYIETGAAHADNDRFKIACEKWYGKTIKTIQNSDYKSPVDVARRRKIFVIPKTSGAPCTDLLKKKVRQDYCGQDDVLHVMGFDYTKREVNRALRFMEQQTRSVYFPLIEGGITKKTCAQMVLKNCGDIPAMYKMGYNNNNCIGCFKGGIGYWNKIKKDFPVQFAEVAELEREIGCSCLKRGGKPLYLDEIKDGEGRHTDFQMPDCGLFCGLEKVRELTLDEAIAQINKIKIT